MDGGWRGSKLGSSLVKGWLTQYPWGYFSSHYKYIVLKDNAEYDCSVADKFEFKFCPKQQMQKYILLVNVCLEGNKLSEISVHQGIALWYIWLMPVYWRL